MKMISRLAAVILAVVFSLSMLPTRAIQAEAVTGIKRLGGADRFDTAVMIADEGWGSSAENVVLANAYNFADALAGVPLAAALDAPVLLTDAKNLNSGVESKIAALGTKNVYILGGTAAIGQAVEDSLITKGYTVKRIAGSTRFETSVLVAEQLEQLKGTPSVIYAAYSHNYPDALAVSSIAGASGCPIIYVPDKGAVDSKTAGYIQSSSCKTVVILGGTAAVGDDVAAQLASLSGSAPERIAGADRYSTALAVCRKYDSILSGSGVAFATGASFPDALAGGALAAKKKIPVILVNKTGKIDGAYEYISSRSHDLRYVFGGTSAVSDDALTVIMASPTSSTTTITTSSSAAASELSCHVIDVGEGLAVLICCDGERMLYDCGEKGTADDVIRYIKKNGGNDLKYLVTSHPHQDHIGGASTIIGQLSISECLLPNVSNDITAYDKMIKGLEYQKIPSVHPSVGDTYSLGSAKIDVLAPCSSSYEEINDYSLVLRVEHGNNSFLLTGDATKLSEDEQLNRNKALLKSTVLIVPHHGAEGSTSPAYALAVKPDIAVISVGADNAYNHPRKEIITRLELAGATVYRTDENGTIVITSDGKDYFITTEKVGPRYSSTTSTTTTTSTTSTTSATSSTKNTDPTVTDPTSSTKTTSTTYAPTGSYIGNINSKVFHRPDCGHLPLEKNRIYFDSRSIALDEGYTPCGFCNP